MTKSLNTFSPDWISPPGATIQRLMVKTGHKGYGKGLNNNQLQFAAGWKGSPVVTLHSPDEAIVWARKVAKGL